MENRQADLFTKLYWTRRNLVEARDVARQLFGDEQAGKLDWRIAAFDARLHELQVQLSAGLVDLIDQPLGLAPRERAIAAAPGD